MEHENEQLDDLPQSLIDELKGAEMSVPLITARVDRSVAEMAADQFSSRPNPILTRRPVWGAIAATVLVAVLVTQFGGFDTPREDTIYADVDNSGRIDIADVLALARTRDPEQITQAELDAFAMRIVSLSSRGDAS